jgi:HD domain
VLWEPGAGQTAPVILDDLLPPDSTAVRTAAEVAEHFSSPALYAHCRRSYLWAASYARARDIAVDEELLFVSAMLHDLGLVPVFDSATETFEEAGGAVAWVFAAGAGWDAARRRRASEIIVAHMAPSVDVAVDPEGHLLELATALDISGRRPEDWPAAFRAEVLERHPRLGLAEEFIGCFEVQAHRKPSSSAGRSVAGGFAARVRANPLDR